MAYGFLIGLVVQGALVAWTLTAPRRPRWLAGLAYRVASAYNEAPFLFIYLIAVSAIGPVFGRFDSAAGQVALGLTLLVIIGLLVIADAGRWKDLSSNAPPERSSFAWPGRDG